VNIIREYDHIVGEHWAIVDGGVVLRLYVGPKAHERAQKEQKRLEADRSHPQLHRTLEAHSRQLQRMRRSDAKARSDAARLKNGQRQRRRQRRRIA
jgi:hypothetical protein